ncbi:hypothetical protein ACL6C3_07140 [Capilliphycus salinus ALCB114379]|uniref:hypothetical protein n=1 Tax=Capilliphycus salinus TaxID=2768948 RepID=UPI0039A4742E
MATRLARDYKRGIGVFKTRRQVEQALYQLRDRGFNLEQVSVMAPHSDPATKDAEVDVYTHSEGNHADTGAVTGAIAGGTLGIIGGLLVGLGAAAIPGIGPILLAGAEATAIATTLAGTAIGATSGGIIGALIGLGIPEDQAKVYNDRLSQGEYIVLVTGTPRSVDEAEDILRDQGIEQWQVYDALQVEITPTMDDVVSPTVLERKEKERAIITPPEVKSKVEHREHPEVIKQERTIVTPRVETENSVEYDARKPEVIEHKQRQEIVTTTPPVKGEIEHQDHREIERQRAMITPPIETRNPVKSNGRHPEVIEHKQRPEKIATTASSVKPKVVHQEHSKQVMKPEENTNINPRVETDNSVEYSQPVETENPVEYTQQPEALEPKQRRQERANITPPPVKPKVVHQERPEIMEREERKTVTPRVEIENPVESNGKAARIERETIVRQPAVTPEHSEKFQKENHRNLEGKKISDDPEIIIIDRRNEKYKDH